MTGLALPGSATSSNFVKAWIRTRCRKFLGTTLCSGVVGRERGVPSFLFSKYCILFLHGTVLKNTPLNAGVPHFPFRTKTLSMCLGAMLARALGVLIEE